MDNDKISSTIASLGISEKNSCLVRKLVFEKYETIFMVSAHLLFLAGLVVFILPFAVRLAGTCDDIDGSAERTCFWSGIFLMGISRARINRSKMRRAIIEVMEKTGAHLKTYDRD